MRGDAEDNYRFLVILTIVTSVALCSILFAAWSCTKRPAEPVTTHTATPERIHYSYEWEDGDYANGHSDEAAAAHILLRANHFENVDYERLDTLPSTNEAIFIAEPLNRVVDAAADCVVPITQQNLLFLPAPSIIWIQDEEGPRPVVFLYADEAEVTVADPRNGIVTHPFSVLQKAYDRANRQAVYIADRGYTAISG